jgi:serine/threonine protein phosphatase 1
LSEQGYIAIGDIHGCAQSLKALIVKLKAEQKLSERTLVFVGDYIDRGPDSSAVIDFLINLSENRDCVFLRGNHEQMMIDAFEENDFHLWMMNGGRSTLESYGDFSGDVPQSHKDFVNNTELYFETEAYFFVHAGANPDRSLQELKELPNAKDYYLWNRDHLDFETPLWEKKVVFGHTPVKDVILDDYRIGIDTGCVYQRSGMGKLTAVLLPEEEIIQQDCIDPV